MIPVFVPGTTAISVSGSSDDAVVGPVASGDRLAQLGHPLERRVAVHRRVGGVQHRLAHGLDRLGRRREVRVAPPEVDEPLAGLRARLGRRLEDPGEELLREAAEQVGH